MKIISLLLIGAAFGSLAFGNLYAGSIAFALCLMAACYANRS